jgi:hypothetical protein
MYLPAKVLGRSVICLADTMMSYTGLLMVSLNFGWAE